MEGKGGRRRGFAICVFRCGPSSDTITTCQREQQLVRPTGGGVLPDRNRTVTVAPKTVAIARKTALISPRHTHHLFSADVVHFNF
jgi:hypothetical protein